MIPALFWSIFGLGYLITSLTGCSDELRNTAEEIAPPSGVEVKWQGTETGSCRSEVDTDLSGEEIIAHYEAQFKSNGWEVVPGTSGMKGIAGQKDDTLFEVGWVQAPGESAMIVLSLSDLVADE